MSAEQGKKIAASMVSSTMEWFDAEQAKQTVNECVKFSKKLVDEVMRRKLKEVKEKDLMQMLAYVGKTLDQVARLTQFSAGAADSRQEVTVSQLLPLLTPTELAVFDAALLRLETDQATGAPTKSELH